MGTQTPTIDLETLRRDPIAFIEHPDFLGLTLDAFQKNVLRDESPTVVHVAGRGCGKTIELLSYGTWKAWTRQRACVVYMAAREIQVKRACEQVLGLVAGTELDESIVSHSTEKIKLTNGSVIHFLTGNSPVAARGLHRQLTRQGEPITEIVLLLDESKDIPREAMVASSLILASAPRDKRKRLVMGSAGATNNWFFDEYSLGLDPTEKFTSSHTTNALDVPRVDAELLAELEQKLTPIEYDAEVRGIFSEALNSFFGDFTDQAVVPEFTIPLEPLDGRPHDVEYSLGLDLSTSVRPGSDWTVFVVCERDWKEDKIRPCYISRFQYLDSAGVLEELQKIKRAYPGIKKLTTETFESMQLENMVGWGKDKVGIRLDRLAPTNQLQNIVFRHFLRLLRDGILDLPSDGENAKQLLKEMKQFQCAITPHGNMVFHAIEEGNAKDDIVYAMGYAIHGLRKRLPVARAGFRDGKGGFSPKRATKRWGGMYG